MTSVFGKFQEIRLDDITDKDGEIEIEVGPEGDCERDWIGREDAAKIAQQLITLFHLTEDDIRLYSDG